MARQERRCHESRTIAQPASRSELAHGGIDDRDTGPPLSPGRHTVRILGTPSERTRQRGHRRPVIGPMVEGLVLVELAPRQLPHERRGLHVGVQGGGLDLPR